MGLDTALVVPTKHRWRTGASAGWLALAHLLALLQWHRSRPRAPPVRRNAGAPPPSSRRRCAYPPTLLCEPSAFTRRRNGMYDIARVLTGGRQRSFVAGKLAAMAATSSCFRASRRVSSTTRGVHSRFDCTLWLFGCHPLTAYPCWQAHLPLARVTDIGRSSPRSGPGSPAGDTAALHRFSTVARLGPARALVLPASVTVYQVRQLHSKGGENRRPQVNCDVRDHVSYEVRVTYALL